MINYSPLDLPVTARYNRQCYYIFHNYKFFIFGYALYCSDSDACRIIARI